MNIYVLGDYGLDRYHIGRVKGISAEAPIPVLTGITSTTLPGMGGNVAANLEALGARATLILPQGVDEARTLLPCPVKNRLFDDAGHQLARWDESDTCEPLRKSDLIALMNADAVVVADYGKGAITPEIIEILRGVTIPLFVDTKSDPSAWIGTEATLFPNWTEFKRYEEAYSNLPRVVLKRGAEGISYLQYGRTIFQRPSLAQFAKCVNGAGDTVLAAFTIASLVGIELPHLLEVASAAAALVVESDPLTRTTSEEDIFSLLDLLNEANEAEVVGFEPEFDEVETDPKKVN